MSEERLVDRDPSEPVDGDSFEDRVVASIYDMFWAPEIERRGGIEAIGGSLWAALAVLPANGPVVVRLNSEVHLAARSTGEGQVSPGDPLTIENVEYLKSVEPADVDPDAGWALLATLPGERTIVAFDYRRNRGRANDLLSRADEFCATGTWCLEGECLAAAVECLHAAAELAVSSLMAVGNAGPPKKRNVHEYRVHWLNHFAHLGNAPHEFDVALRQLNEWRPGARYLDAGSDLPDRAEVEVAQEAVVELLAHARARSGQLTG